MQRQWVPNKGFTVVELLVVIVVIGILAAITIAAFNGIQRRASATSIKSDLAQAAKSMSIAQAKSNQYPAILPADIRTSPGTTLRLVATGTPTYNGMSAVQQGVLFQELCQQLIAEGRGNGSSLSGQVGTYITGCNVYGWQGIQLNGWQSHTFNVPITQTAIRDWYNSRSAYDAWWPDQKTVAVDFANELSARFTAMGGAFPVTSFWDNWSSGVQKETLPAPTPPHDPLRYCIEGSHSKYTDMLWHVSSESTLTEGAC